MKEKVEINNKKPFKNRKTKKKNKYVNYHFTRKCNSKCAFCFHTSKTSFILWLEETKGGLKLLKESGKKKINFTSAEPFLYQPFLGQLI